MEGMFVQMMLKSMRDALPKDGLFSSEHTRLYTSMYDQQIAQQMTAGKGLGLAEMMVKQMTPEQPLPEESTPAAPMKDTGGLALLLHLIDLAKKQGNNVTLQGVNDKVYTLAKLYNLPADVLPR